MGPSIRGTNAKIDDAKAHFRDLAANAAQPAAGYRVAVDVDGFLIPASVPSLGRLHRVAPHLPPDVLPMPTLTLEAGKARLDSQERQRAATCFFCGATFHFQTGDIICYVRVDGLALPRTLDRHVCNACAKATPDALQARLTAHVAGLRGQAGDRRREADAFDALADAMAGIDVHDAPRVWKDLF